jgi:tetratricopeptide (TPR) repeat protein
LETRLSRICSAVIEAGWLSALVVAPLFFNTFSSRVFEPDKIHLVRSIALIMVVAWLIEWLDSGLRRPRGSSVRGALLGTPLVLPTLLLVASYLLSTVLSVVPRISFFGSYVRMQGTLSFLSYVVIFALVLTHLRTRRQVNRLLHAIILTSLPIAIFGIIQSAGLDPLPWGGDVQSRVAANMGNPIFVAAYLIVAVFLTLERLFESLTAMFSDEQGGQADALAAGAYLFVLAVQLAAIVLTQSRGPWIGLAAGLYIFVMLGLLLLARWAASRSKMPAALRWLARHVRAAWLSLIGLTVAGLALLIVLNVPHGPLASVCQARYVDRLCTLFSTSEGTNAVRVLIWEGVVDMMLKPHDPIQKPDGTPDAFNAIRPLVGYGPESMWVAYNRFYPADLAHYESRKASPDRSHNETFDALVRGGILQFAAQIYLFCSIFYYSLRWLGLMAGPGRRRLFAGLLALGGSLGVVIPLLADRSLRLAGIGLPAGLIVGVIVYVTIDLLLTGDSQGSLAGDSAPAPTATEATGRRQLLILALFAALVAHFVEVHSGIAIVATLTHFWALAGLLVVVGMGWVRDDAVAVEAAEAVVAETPGAASAAASAAIPASVSAGKRKAGKAPQSPAQRTPANAPRGQAASSARPKPGQGSRAPAVPTPPEHAPLLVLLPYVLLGVMVTVILVWDFIVNLTGADNALTIFADAFTRRLSNYQFVRSPMLLVLIVFTWVIGGLLALTEAAQLTPARPGASAQHFPWLAGTSIYAVAVIATFFVFGLFQAWRVNLTGLTQLAPYQRVAGHIVWFDLVLALVLFGLAAAIAVSRRASPGHAPARAFGRSPLLSLGAGAGAAVLAVLVIANINIQTVQADTYYKNGLGFEGVGDWESSVVLYREAARLEPSEDYYQLFLGRALLQFSDLVEPGAATLPENLDNVPTSELPDLIGRGVRSRTREDVMRAAQAALIAAQRLNPYNTDHSANLARLDRAWAFSETPGAGNGTSNQLRDIVMQQPDQVQLDKLRRSVERYQQTLSLSPQNAGLWNELATVQYILNDLDAARETLSRSLTVDRQYYPTYVQLGDVKAAQGDREGALAAYQQASLLAPNDVAVLSALAVYSADSGDPQAALDAFARIVDIETAALQSTEARLNQLNATVQALGGYDQLQPSAASQQQTLMRQAAMHRSQLFLSLRNIALVQRDTGQTAEALKAAQQAGQYAADADRASIDALIADLQKQSSP